jgi:hypothetical protein
MRHRPIERALLKQSHDSLIRRTSHHVFISQEPSRFRRWSFMQSRCPKTSFSPSKPPWFPVSLSLTSHVTSPNPKVRIRDMIRRLEASIGLVSFPPFHGVSSPTTFLDASSDPRRACLTRLCCAFRFSQPLDALFRSHLLGLVSCRSRPWGCAFRGFPPLEAATAFTARSPLPRLRPPQPRFRAAPKSVVSAMHWWVPPRIRSEERLRGTTR